MKRPAPGGNKLPRSFFVRDTLTVAVELLGTHLVRVTGRGRMVGRIVEVEAYPGEGDPASHSYGGMTARNEVMFGRGGTLYVYFTYGMHYCANVVTGKAGEGSAVLIRAVEPLEGIRRMAANRGIAEDTVKPREFTGGPARVSQAFGLTTLQNGTDLTGPEIFLLKGEAPPRPHIVTSLRVGISKARGRKWRYYLRDNPYVSKK